MCSALAGGRALGLVVGVVGDEREVQLGLRAGRQVRQRGEVGRVVAGLGHGERRPSRAAARRRGHGVDEVDLHLQRLGLLEVLVAVVAVAEVQPDRDVGGHPLDAADQPGRDLLDRQRRAVPSRPPGAPNSTATSHWTAMRSCGSRSSRACRGRRTAPPRRRPRRRAGPRARSSRATEASGVGYCIWRRTPAGIVPSFCSRSKIANDLAYASA